MWLQLLKIGTTGDTLDRAIRDRLPFDRFGITLNAGHLIHLDEWLSSPVYPGCDITIHSGMAVQIDVIPTSTRYFSTRMEDGVVIADASLRRRIQLDYPQCYERMHQRRNFMTDVLGFERHDEVLLLSNIAGIAPPFLLRPQQTLALD